MATAKPLILITNDDGVSAPDSGINRRYGRNRRRFSRGTRQTSKWHGPCYNHKQHFVFKQNIENDVIEEYSCSGTPWIVLN
jgi:broad specificity polyphosphatase/5'/3'-nucleotidase SurE